MVEVSLPVLIILIADTLLWNKKIRLHSNGAYYEPSIM